MSRPVSSLKVLFKKMSSAAFRPVWIDSSPHFINISDTEEWHLKSKKSKSCTQSLNPYDIVYVLFLGMGPIQQTHIPTQSELKFCMLVASKTSGVFPACVSKSIIFDKPQSIFCLSGCPSSSALNRRKPKINEAYVKEQGWLSPPTLH